MKLKELAKPYMKWVIQGIEGAKHLYNELEANFPQIDTKLSYSSLDESILVEKSIEGNISKETYLLKTTKDGKKFEYKHELTDDEDLNDIRNKAWTQKEAWEYSIEQTKLNKTEDGKIKQSEQSI